MFTSEYRPRKFSEVFGQETNVEVIKSFVRDPFNAPRSLIFHGVFGTGKTTCARILAKSLNCKGKGSGFEPCLDCDSCQDTSEFNPFYREYDSSEVGSVETIRKMKDEIFAMSTVAEWRVVVFDEYHLSSRAAQSALLKSLEDIPKRIFVLFCTTEIEKIIPTIRSRSIELQFELVPPDMIRANLDRIAQCEGMDVGADILDKIAFYSRGHVRDSVMKLDQYRMSANKDDFISTLKSAELDLITMLTHIKTGTKESFKERLKQVCLNVLDTVKLDYHQVLKNAIENFVMGNIDSIYGNYYDELSSAFGPDLFRLLKYSTASWAVNVFQSDSTLQAFFWSIYMAFRNKAQESKGSSLMEKARKR